MYFDGADRHGVSRTTIFLPNTIWRVKLIVDCGPIEMCIMTETDFEIDDDDDAMYLSVLVLIHMDIIDYFWVSQGKKPTRNKNTAVNNYVCRIVHWICGCCQFAESFPITLTIRNLETLKWLIEPRSTKLLWKLHLTMISQQGVQ